MLKITNISRLLLRSRSAKILMEKFVAFSTIKHTDTLELQRNKPPIDKMSKAQSPKSILMQPDELMDYITDRTRSLEDLLSIDVREFTVDYRLSCLEAILQIAYLTNSKRDSMTFCQAREQNISPIASHPQAITFDRFTEVTAISIGINPSSTAALGFLPINFLPFSHKKSAASWLCDKRFSLLLLSTVAGAKNLTRPRLLVLAACLRQLLNHVSEKNLASVLRLITLQINEASTSELVYIGSILNGLPYKPSSTDKKNVHEITVLSVEADLLRQALNSHLMNRLIEMETLGILPLLRLGYDFGSDIRSAEDKIRFLGTIETVMSMRLKEQNLFTTCLLFSTMQRMNKFRPGLIRRCLGQIQRKLHLATHYPLTDQSSWLSSAVTSLANLAIGGNLSTNFTNTQYSRLPFEADLFSSTKPTHPAHLTYHQGLDIHDIFTSDWVRQVLFSVADYTFEHGERRQNETKLDFELAHDQDSVNGFQPLVRTSLGLLMLGIRHEKLIEKCSQLLSSRYSKFVALHISKPSELLVTNDSQLFSISNLSKYVPVEESSLELIELLPRIDWQLYYKLAHSNDKALVKTIPYLSDMNSSLFQNYIELKQESIEQFIASLNFRLDASFGVEIFPFHVVEIENGPRFFADIIMRKKSTVDPSVYKYVLCYMHWKRDEMVHRPLECLLNSYSQNCPLPLHPFLFTNELGKGHTNQQRDQFLKNVSSILIEHPGIALETTSVYPITKTTKHL